MQYKKNTKYIFSNIIYVLGILRQYTPEYLFFIIFEGIMQGIMHAVTSVIFVKVLFDQLESGVSYKNILYTIGIMALFYIVMQLYHVWYWDYYNPILRKRLQKRLQTKLYEKAASLDLHCYDNSKFYDDFVWATQEADERVLAIADDISRLINRVFSCALISGVLFSIEQGILLLILVFVIICIWTGKKLVSVNYQFNMKIQPVKRICDYVERVFFIQDFACDIKITNVDKLALEKYSQGIKLQKDINKKYANNKIFVTLLNILSEVVLCDCLIKVILAFKLIVANTITLGEFTASSSAVWKLYWIINSFLEMVIKIGEHSLYISKFRSFLDYKNEIVSGDRLFKNVEMIEIRKLSFKYDNSYVLNNINIRVPKGKKIAIVGYNGAGKSTLVKLLMRLYQPTSGEIIVNGNNLDEYSLDSIRNNISVIFQDFSIFSLSIGENVIAGSIKGKEDRIIEALDVCCFTEKLSQLNDGISTKLFAEINNDGIDLSGGEKQKIAIARMFAKKAEIYIMDEPSAELDPESEYNINQYIFNELIDQTMLIISHRLTMTRNADYIYVLKNGEIVEEGNHNELMSKHGLYNEMFNVQRNKYFHK